MSAPLPLIVNTPFVYFALPASPTGPMSRSAQPGGNTPTFKPTVVLRLVPLVRVSVSVKLPAGVDPAVVTVSVEEPAPLIEAGLKLAPAPAGNPLALDRKSTR